MLFLIGYTVQNLITIRKEIWKIWGYLIYWEKNFHEKSKVCCRSCRIVFRKCNYLAIADPITVFCPCFPLDCCAYGGCCGGYSAPENYIKKMKIYAIVIKFKENYLGLLTYYLKMIFLHLLA